MNGLAGGGRQDGPQIYTQTDIHRDGYTHGQIYTWTDIHTDRYIHGWIYTQMDIHTDRYIHRQIDVSYTHIRAHETVLDVVFSLLL